MDCGRNCKSWKINSANWRTVFDIPKKRQEISNIEAEMSKPDFWADHKKVAERSQELADLKREAERFDKLDAEVKSLAENPSRTEALVVKLEKEIAALEIELYFAGKYDKGDAVLSVYAGAGGKDAEDWSALLVRMFRRFAENRGWKTRTIHEHWGEYQGPGGWGIKNATIAIEGQHAYGYLKKESGVHRLVRISPFSSQQLRHTSFALVDVMPKFVAPEEIEIKPDELKIDFFRSSGPGGQNVNKRETAVRITHLATGLQVASQIERSQDRNREIAMNLLRSRLYQLSLQRQDREKRGIRQAAFSGRASPAEGVREKVKIEWGNQIRSYVMHPYQMVKDHRTGIETSKIDAILDGGLDEFIKAEVRA